jgi:hypothetical protein
MVIDDLMRSLFLYGWVKSPVSCLCIERQIFNPPQQWRGGPRQSNTSTEADMLGRIPHHGGMSDEALAAGAMATFGGEVIINVA